MSIHHIHVNPIGCSFSYLSKSVLATILAEVCCVRLKLTSIGQNQTLLLSATVSISFKAEGIVFKQEISVFDDCLVNKMREGKDICTSLTNMHSCNIFALLKQICAQIHIDVNCVNTKRILLHSRAFSNTNRNAPQALNTFQTVPANQLSLMDTYFEKCENP